MATRCRARWRHRRQQPAMSASTASRKARWASTNYTVSSFAGANLTVTPRAITVTADAKSRAYGDANPVLTCQVGGSGLANGDTLSGALATSATAASNVGVYGITQGSLAASSNYAFTFVGANLTITPAAPQVPTERPGSYVKSPVPVPAPHRPSGRSSPKASSNRLPQSSANPSNASGFLIPTTGELAPGPDSSAR